LQKLAERLDFEVFVSFSKLSNPASPLEFHFEPWRGRAPLDTTMRNRLRIDRERNLLDFNPTIKVPDQCTTFRVRGRHRDPQIPEEVSGSADDAAILIDELPRDPGDGKLIPAPSVRAVFFPERSPNHSSKPNVSNMDGVRAEWYAQTLMRRKARELFTIDVTAVGTPFLRPGVHVEIRGMRPPFDGFYYVTKATHSIGTDGYRTKLSALRPGMELPMELTKKASLAKPE
jgi:hypothetical protein